MKAIRISLFLARNCSLDIFASAANPTPDVVPVLVRTASPGVSPSESSADFADGHCRAGDGHGDPVVGKGI